MVRSETGTEDPCEACERAHYENNPADYAEQLLAEECAACPLGREVDNPLLFLVMGIMELVEAGCPVGRHELRDEHWRLVPALKAERERLQGAWAEEERSKGDG